MVLQPNFSRILGKVTAGADNVQIRVAADGSVYIITDPANPLNIRKLAAGNNANGDNVLIAGTDDAGVTMRFVKTLADGTVVVQVGTVPSGTDVLKTGQQLAVAANATVKVVPANAAVSRYSFVNMHGTGSFKWEVRFFDGAAETVIARGMTSPAAPHNKIDLGNRYGFTGDGTKAFRVYATNIDLTLQADADAEIVGNV
jgi:hypothetical protein